MKLLFKSPKLWKDSAILAFAFLAAIETIMSVAAISLASVEKWWVRLLLIIAVYCVLTIGTLLVKFLYTKKSITLSIRGIQVTVKQGDLFKTDTWKMIPFNEQYDTQVDDIIINKNSLNGIFIEKCVGVDNLKELQQVIYSADDESRTLFKRSKKGERWLYPLGRIKIYQDYMLLAFTHFNEQSEAHTTRAKYEQCLRVMWQEISRTYANKPVALPLLGSGITRFDDWAEKSNKELLKCILCTLRTSNVYINQPITILLTEEAVQEINLYELKGV